MIFLRVTGDGLKAKAVSSAMTIKCESHHKVIIIGDGISFMGQEEAIGKRLFLSRTETEMAGSGDLGRSGFPSQRIAPS